MSEKILIDNMSNDNKDKLSNGIIRKAAQSDLPKLLDVDGECDSIVIMRLKIGKDKLKEALHKRLNESNKEFYVYEIKKNVNNEYNKSEKNNCNKEIAGYATLKLEFPGYKNCELSWIAVKQKYHNKGIGKKLAKFIEKLAKKKGFRNIYAYTSEKGNDKVHQFYKKLKYRKINALEDYYSDGTRAVLYGKSLNE
ncbi:GNAT family N-acetyltransferase [Candidatus Woesearchaeota archaeon]|nr:GNAT family N-acetyltransferase [Candidatus Woesearchaeota archaeon]